MHVCPQVTVLVPHVGGPILPPCEPTVLIGMLPAARITDMLTCVGPPDVILMGSPTVLIGSLLAARIGDPTAHGGVIVLGCFTVIIGEAGAPSPSAPPMPPTPSIPEASAVAADTPSPVAAPMPSAPSLPLGAVSAPPGPRLPEVELTAPGFPPLPKEEAGNFMSAKPVTFPKGTKLYRIIDDTSNPSGSYWALSMPKDEAQWRSQSAVKPKWNKDGMVVEHEVQDDAGLKAWVGPASSQDAAPGAIYPGGGIQAWVPKGAATAGAAKPTKWSA